MAVKIRLKRLGKIRQPHYRIVVVDARAKRDGKTIEEVGKYWPKTNPSYMDVRSERVQYWLSVGAQPTEPVLAILKRTGDWQQFRGLPAPKHPVGQPEQGADRRARFDELLRAAHGESGRDAETGDKAGSAKAEKSSKSNSSKPAKADSPKADSPKADSPKADSPKAGSSKAESSKSEAAKTEPDAATTDAAPTGGA